MASTNWRASVDTVFGCNCFKIRDACIKNNFSYSEYIVTNMKNHYVILFYKFINLPDPKAVADAQRKVCADLGLMGRVIIADEGINATLEGTREQVDAYKEFLKQDEYFFDILVKESPSEGNSFHRLSVKVRPEIVTLGAGKFDVKNQTATELPAQELQKWYENNEDFVVLDLRNDYEIASGKFEKTIPWFF